MRFVYEIVDAAEKRRGNMNSKLYTDGCPEEARKIREKVFIEEQGFLSEFDDLDAEAAHVVIYADKELPVATCRVFWDEEKDSYVIGRLAVCREWRGKKLGAAAVQEAERYILQNHGHRVALHAQCRARSFYEKLGFVSYGEIDEDEGCAHIWMKKELS